MRLIPWLAGLAFLLQAMISVADEAGVQHEISFPDYRLQYAHVVSEFPVEGDETVLIMPAWTPGSYLIREFAAGVGGLDVHDADGAPLFVEKVAKNRWRVDSDGVKRVVVSYDVHTPEMSVSTSWVSPEFVLLNGASVFLYTDAGRDQPQRLTVSAPTELGEVHTSLESLPGDSVYLAASYDDLVDSPVVVARAQLRQFESGSVPHVIVNVGDVRMWDLDKAANDVNAVTDAIQAVWGENPLDRGYWFHNLLVERGGGLEHDESTVLMTSRWQMRTREDYIKWLSLVAHEYFHTWNVRTMRPAALMRYDYEREQYIGELWLAEGLTSYYDNLVLTRAQLIQPTEYFELLAKDIHRFETTPGRAMISAEEASRDTWIRHYRPNPNSPNSTLSYYTRGAIIGFLVDTRLRQDSDGKLSLDHVMREMYRRYGNQGYPPHAFERLVAEMGDGGLDAWLDSLLRGTTDPDFDAALSWYGLEIIRDPDRDAAEIAGQPIKTGFGVTWDKDKNSLVIDTVLHGHSGARAGLLPGDELLAIEGHRVLPGDLDDRLTRLQPGETVTLLLARRERVIEVPVEAQVAIPARYQVQASGKLRSRDLRRMGSWLGQQLEVARPKGF